MTSELAVGLYGALALGAAGTFWAAPGRSRRWLAAGGVLGLAALALLGSTLIRHYDPGNYRTILFCVFAAWAILAAARVITTPKPVYAALYLVLVVLAVAGLLVLADAEFLAGALVIVYAGAIVVTYIFVLMLAHSTGQTDYDAHSRDPFLSTVVGFAITAAICGAVVESPASLAPIQAQAPVAAPPAGHTLALGAELLTTYAVALELAGLLLLVAIVGAIYITRQPAAVEPSDKEES